MVYVALAMKHLRLMVLLMCLSLLMGLTLYVFLRPVYFSKDLIELKELPLPITTDTVYQDNNKRTLLAQFNSPHITERVAASFGIQTSDKYFRRKYLRKAVYRFNSQGNIEAEVWMWSREMTDKWVERVLKEYLAYRAEQRQIQRDMVLNDFTKEMEQISTKMEEWINANYSYQDSNKVAELTVQLKELRAIPMELAQVNYQLDELKKLKAKVSSSNFDLIERLSLLSSYSWLLEMKIGDSFRIAPEAAQNVFSPSLTVNAPAGAAGDKDYVVVPALTSANQVRPWTDLETEYRRTKQQAAELALKFLPAHPAMKEVNERLSKIERGLQADLESGLKRVDVRTAELVARQDELAKKLPAYLEAQRQEAKLKIGADQLASGQLRWRSFYDSLAKSVTQMEFGDDKERLFLSYAGMLEERLDPPASPNRLNLLIYFFIIGIGLALGVPFLIEYLDHTITTVESGEDTLKMRALGVVPQLSAGNDLEQKEAQLATSIENFRVIRTNMLFSNEADRNSKVIMVASAMPQEGKTYVARHIAMSFARKGDRTLLIDADVRRGTVHNAFKMASSPGLVEVLNGKIPLETVIRSTDVPNLEVMVRGRFEDSAADQFGEKIFITLMQSLRDRYDRIIIDTPPVLGLAETSALLPAVDGVVFVVWSGRTPLRTVKIAIDTLRANGANFMGFVLNRLDLSATSNYYYYYYYSHNYYESYQPADRQ
jgi:capsular exopolysaccharide synthesis family protein